MSNKQTTGRLRGLRWSPKPVKHYTASGASDCALAGLRSTFLLRPDVWNLFWICAAGMEDAPLEDAQVEVLYRAADASAAAKFLGSRCGGIALAHTPGAFTDLLEANPRQASELPLGRLLKHNLVWVARQRSALFYQARLSDFGLEVPMPEPMDETSGGESTNILRLYRLSVGPPG